MTFVGLAGQRSNLLVGPRPTKLAEIKKPAVAKALAGEVGKTGFEPATPCTPYKCATGLRHFPKTGCKCRIK